MSALNNLFLEIEKHGMMKAHGTLILEAQQEYSARITKTMTLLAALSAMVYAFDEKDNNDDNFIQLQSDALEFARGVLSSYEMKEEDE